LLLDFAYNFKNFLDNHCFPYGHRSAGKYCADSREFLMQSKSDASCENNFECKSNVCISGKCLDQSFLDRIIAFFKRLFGIDSNGQSNETSSAQNQD